MPLDHYVPQVHLRKFYSPTLGTRMYAIHKSDLKVFTPRSQDVCRIMDGSTNAYLIEDRAIEYFLKTVEPKYNAALDKLVAGEIDNTCIYTIAGFVAFVISCSPAGVRIGSERLRSTVATSTSVLEAKGLLPPPPPELGDTTITELLRDGAFYISIDPKYPQAIGITSILELTARFGNCKWEILHNDFDDSPFFTSDFPAAIEKTDTPLILNRIVPLAPNLALRIKPELTPDKGRMNFSFTNFGCRSRKVGRKEIVKLNCLIVRCAEDSVFYRDDNPWVRPFVTKNRYFHVEPHTHRLTTPAGTLQVFMQKVVSKTPPIEPSRSNSG
ncbi:MAG: DUF4238 domain-containing protein [Desulfobaccales bacterium]